MDKKKAFFPPVFLSISSNLRLNKTVFSSGIALKLSLIYLFLERVQIARTSTQGVVQRYFHMNANCVLSHCWVINQSQCGISSFADIRTAEYFWVWPSMCAINLRFQRKLGRWEDVDLCTKYHLFSLFFKLQFMFNWFAKVGKPIRSFHLLFCVSSWRKASPDVTCWRNNNIIIENQPFSHVKLGKKNCHLLLYCFLKWKKKSAPLIKKFDPYQILKN